MTDKNEFVKGVVIGMAWVFMSLIFASLYVGSLLVFALFIIAGTHSDFTNNVIGVALFWVLIMNLLTAEMYISWNKKSLKDLFKKKK